MSTSKLESIWLCLHFHQLALDIVSRDEPHEERPLVITEKQRVYECNEAAASLGVKRGQSMDTAFTLADRVASIERDADREVAVIKHLAQWAYQFTPHIAIKSTGATPDSLILEVAGSLKLFGGLPALRRRIQQGLLEQNYHATVAVSRTPEAAILKAVSNSLDPAVTSMDTSIYTPNDIENIGIHHLQTSHKIIAGLQQMGIQNLRQLLDLPSSGLTRRFGTYFTDYLQRLTGDKPDPQTFISPTANFYHDVTFLDDVTNLESLAFPINRLLGELCDFLNARQLWINHMTWHLSHRNHPRHTFSVYLAAPGNDSKMFLTLTQLKLDQINTVQEVDHIALSVQKFFPARQASSDLFAAQGFTSQGQTAQACQEQQNQLLNMLTARLGPGKCFGLSEVNDHRPEKAWRKIRLHEKDYWVSPQQDQLPRPSFLLSSPRALNVVNKVPCLGGKLTLIKGPERIDFGWWDQPVEKPLARDYYVARQRDGGLLWIFQHVAMERWYLHGIFS